MTPISNKRHRFPGDIIQHAIWLCARFTLSIRDIEELLAEHGFDVSNETLRRLFLQFGRLIAANLRRARPRPSVHWHLDEMVAGNVTGFGVPSTTRARFSISWFRVAAMEKSRRS